ncbi:ABC transporter permease [Eubacteriales bacterium mix99]|nr:spermidine/putrescine ABC transporter permease [Clostridiales bacterium]
MVSRFLKKFYVSLIFAFLYVPILVLILFSFNASKSRAHWGGFTLKWYVELFQDQQILSALKYTILIAVLSSAIATLIGLAASIGIFSMRKAPQEILLNLNYLPVLNPDIVTGISLMALYIFTRMPLGFVTMLLSHITFNIPYVILSILPKLKQMNRHLYEAAQDLGATPVVALRKVILPEIMPGVVAGFLLAFTLSLDDFVISFFTTGSGVSNLSILIYSMARRGISPKINALSTLMFSSVLLLLLLVNWLTSRENPERRNKIGKNKENGSYLTDTGHDI